MKTDVLIVGGSAAGIMAAITATNHYPDKQITVVRKEEKVLVPCGIPYTMSTVDGPENNLIPDKAVTGNGAELLIDEVLEIDREEKLATLASGDELSYEKLVLATGSKTANPPVDGTDLDGVFSIKKDIKLLNHIKARLNKSDNLVIIGGGFIGVEFADECRKGRDINVTIVEMEEHCLSLACNDDLCEKAESKLTDNDVNICQNTKVINISGNKKVESVQLDNGEELPADIVVLATGVYPNTDLAQELGIKSNKQSGIFVDKFIRTSDYDIFACGDCAEKPSFFSNKVEAPRLASIATTEARVVGANLYELRRERPDEIGIFATIIDDLAIGAAGLTKKQANKLGIEVVVGKAAATNRHPGQMPGATELGVELVFKKYDGTLIGAQAYGGDSIGEFTNILGLAIENEMTADDLVVQQVGTHPALTASPVAYQLTNAAEDAVFKLKSD